MNLSKDRDYRQNRILRIPKIQRILRKSSEESSTFTVQNWSCDQREDCLKCTSFSLSFVGGEHANYSLMPEGLVTFPYVFFPKTNMLLTISRSGQNGPNASGWPGMGISVDPIRHYVYICLSNVIDYAGNFSEHYTCFVNFHFHLSHTHNQLGLVAIWVVAIPQKRPHNLNLCWTPSTNACYFAKFLSFTLCLSFFLSFSLSLTHKHSLTLSILPPWLTHSLNSPLDAARKFSLTCTHTLALTHTVIIFLCIWMVSNREMELLLIHCDLKGPLCVKGAAADESTPIGQESLSNLRLARFMHGPPHG